MQYIMQRGKIVDNNPLNASIFLHRNIFCNKEFEDILSGIISCYYHIVSKKILLPPNDENYIRNVILHDYLKNQQFKNKHVSLCNYHFDQEIVEKEGRVDIRVLSVKPYIDDYAYYIIECKRLDNKNQNGISGLNGEYIREGIMRFVSKEYPFYKKTAGMIGFVVAEMDIDQNIENINNLINKIPETNTRKKIIKKQIVSCFNFSYYSIHNIENESKCIYHIMFDLSKNVEFIAHCIEEYKSANGISKKEVSKLFKRYNIVDYISSCYEALCTMKGSSIAGDIYSFIENKKKKEPSQTLKYTGFTEVPND